MINDKLFDELFDIFTEKNNSPDWELLCSEYDLSRCAHMAIDTKPENPEELSEVESFTVHESVMGEIIWTFKRKTENERSKKN